MQQVMEPFLCPRSRRGFCSADADGAAQPLSPDGVDRSIGNWTVQIRSRAVQVNLARICTKKKENSFHAIGINFNPQSGN
jgi:hypothetical protein